MLNFTSFSAEQNSNQIKIKALRLVAKKAEEQASLLYVLSDCGADKVMWQRCLKARLESNNATKAADDFAGVIPAYEVVGGPATGGACFVRRRGRKSTIAIDFATGYDLACALENGDLSEMLRSKAAAEFIRRCPERPCGNNKAWAQRAWRVASSV